ncbi:MAG TPA: ester cyclase [Tahibacter sp.]|nr:ester cyclase [Tahibacter sp.]
MSRIRTIPIPLVLAFTAAVVAACSPASPPQDSAAVAELARIKAVEAEEQKNLVNFDDLDFNVYSNQKWDELPRSHAADIVVHYPDGHTTTGLAAHIDELKPMFVFAPDTKIKVHPIKIAQGNLTSVSGIIEGTFSQPMPIGEGKTIAPTGRPFKLTMVTVGVWENGLMKEEYLYWDNQALLKQIGVAP